MNAPFLSTRLAAEQQQNMVLFRLEQHLYAVLIEQAQQVIDMVTVTPIPQITGSVAGMINFHGKTVPVIDLRRHLGLAELPLHLHTPIILVTMQGRLFGLLVDEVLDVLAFSSDKMINPADVLPLELGSVPMILGLTQTPQGMVILIDLEHLFKAQQTQAIFEAAEAARQYIERDKPVSEAPQPIKRKTSGGAKEKPPKAAKSKPGAESNKKTAKKTKPKAESATPEQKLQGG